MSAVKYVKNVILTFQHSIIVNHCHDFKNSSLIVGVSSANIAFHITIISMKVTRNRNSGEDENEQGDERWEYYFLNRYQLR